jgi:hypothetical protein
LNIFLCASYYCYCCLIVHSISQTYYNEFNDSLLLCCRRAQTEAERAPKLLEASFLSRPAATQQTHVQRLSARTKGAFLICHVEQVTEMGWGVQLVPCIVTCYFIGCSNRWVEATLLWSPGNTPQLQFFLCFTVALINLQPPPTPTPAFLPHSPF